MTFVPKPCAEKMWLLVERVTLLVVVVLVAIVEENRPDSLTVETVLHPWYSVVQLYWMAHQL